jgi:molybdopterin synthase catalytic subunit
MKVKVKFFAILRERAGAGEIIKEIGEGGTVADLWAMLKKEYPKLAPVETRLLFAVNQNYVRTDYELKDGDEVVFIPPVSGGSR